MLTKKQNLTPLQALQKAKQYCAYQERCHSEVKTKLYDYGLNTDEVNECISDLITENYLNEERFAIAYARGKFNIKHWGKVKIKYSLMQKQVSAYCIKKALGEIDLDDYEKVFQKVLEERLKDATVRTEKNVFTKKKKIRDYLQQRGFENDLISLALKTI